MKDKIRRQFISLFLCLPLLVCALDEDGRRALMLNDLEIIKHTFQTGYAPAEWKKTCFGWDLEEEIEKARHQVLEAPGILTTKEFQRILKNFFASTKDYHVGAHFFSTESAILPFTIQGANGRYFFTSIQKDLLSEEDPFPFSVGDEVLLFDEVPIDQVVSDFRENEIGSNHYQTDQALAEMYLTKRDGRSAHTVPQGSILITGIKKDSMTSISHMLEWKYRPEKITSAFLKQAKKGKRESFFNHSDFMWPRYESWAKMNADDEDLVGLGSKKSALPPLGTITWESNRNCFFHAYLFELPSRKMGAYIRIPEYPTGDDEAILEFAKIIQRVQKHADVLVIDQLFNPGGDVLFLHDLASMLTDTPLAFIKHREMINQSDVSHAACLEEILSQDTSPLDLTESELNYCRFIAEEWNQGRQFTSLYPISGIDQIVPHPHTRYTKPLLILVNSLSVSCGDLFPAIMQDNKRAIIIGTRTAGAGGEVKRFSFPNLSGLFYFSYTGSLAERHHQQLIENQGVMPDIIYEVSENDLMNEYADYRKKIIETMESLIPTVAEENER
jgi:hypothetical protein